jgi:hypothetical protein
LLSDFGLRYDAFNTFADVAAIEVSITDMPEETTARVQISTDSVAYQPLAPGESLVLCKDEADFVIYSVASRAYDDDAAFEFSVNFEPLEEHDDCEEDEPAPDDEEEDEEEPICLAGTYTVSGIPFSDIAASLGDIAGPDDISIGSIVLTIGEEGQISHVAEDFNINTNMEGMSMLVSIDLAVSGQMNVQTTDGTTFNVNQFDYSVDRITATANIGGQVMDLSTLASDMMSEFSGSIFRPPVKLVCTDLGLDYYVTVSGVQGIWVYEASGE